MLWFWLDEKFISNLKLILIFLHFHSGNSNKETVLRCIQSRIGTVTYVILDCFWNVSKYFNVQCSLSFCGGKRIQVVLKMKNKCTEKVTHFFCIFSFLIVCKHPHIHLSATNENGSVEMKEALNETKEELTRWEIKLFK